MQEERRASYHAASVYCPGYNAGPFNTVCYHADHAFGAVRDDAFHCAGFEPGFIYSADHAFSAGQRRRVEGNFGLHWRGHVPRRDNQVALVKQTRKSPLSLTMRAITAYH
jgi:hypothetical protein